MSACLSLSAWTLSLCSTFLLGACQYDCMEDGASWSQCQQDRTFILQFARLDKWWQMAMDQYLLIPFLVGWTSIYQLFWCSPGVPGFWHTAKWGFVGQETLTLLPLRNSWAVWSFCRICDNGVSRCAWEPTSRVDVLGQELGRSCQPWINNPPGCLLGRVPFKY